MLYRPRYIAYSMRLRVGRAPPCSTMLPRTTRHSKWHTQIRRPVFLPFAIALCDRSRILTGGYRQRTCVHPSYQHHRVVTTTQSRGYAISTRCPDVHFLAPLFYFEPVQSFRAKSQDLLTIRITIDGARWVIRAVKYCHNMRMPLITLAS